jgi:tRNA(fMet)-specific endonuclease VapC
VLQAAGTPIGSLDMLIAGHALSRNLILLTHNLKEFKRVPGLKAEDWTKA